MKQSQTRFLHVQKVTPNVVRTIFDSCYLRPEENPRVINDTDTAKAHIIAVAEKRVQDKAGEYKQRNSVIEKRQKTDRDQ